jgi:GDP-L-fucose synthase
MGLDYLIAGGTGLVGSALVKEIKNRGLEVIGISSKDADLRNYSETRDILEKLKPKKIIDAAAKVGGIKFNNDYPVDFLLDNLRIQSNLMQAAHEVSVEKFIFLGSSCVYPKFAAQPIKEECLMTGPLEETNSAYAIAKISGMELLKAYRKQFNHSWISLMPTNVFGPNDNFHQEYSHVVPSLISKFIKAKSKGLKSVEVWGTGQARREFIYSEDLAKAILFCADNYNSENHLNIGTGQDISIRELAILVSEIINFSGKINFNTSYPDGTPQKLLDISKLKELGFTSQRDLRSGLTQTIEWYLKNYEGNVSWPENQH